MTAFEFIGAGVEIDARANRVVWPVDREDLKPLVTAELARRIESFEKQFPLIKDVPAPVMRMPGVVPARAGSCDCCGDPMVAYRGGMCGLCELALMRALEKAGRI